MWRRQWHPLQYSCLENPMGGGAWKAAVPGVAKSRTRLSDFTFTFHFHALEKEMATHFSVLAWRIPGTAEPGGLPSMRSHRVRHGWSDLAAWKHGDSDPSPPAPWPWLDCLFISQPANVPLLHAPSETLCLGVNFMYLLTFSLFIYLLTLSYFSKQIDSYMSISYYLQGTSI